MNISFHLCLNFKVFWKISEILYFFSLIAVSVNFPDQLVIDSCSQVMEG